MATTKKYTDPLLTKIAKGHRPRGHVNEIILPQLGVVKPSAKIGVYDGSSMRLVTTIKAPEGQTPTVTFTTDQADAYTLEEHALKAMAADKIAENQENPFNEQRDKTEFVMDLLSVAREYGLSSYMNDDGNFTNTSTLSGTSQWSGDDDDPLGDVKTAIGTAADAMNQYDGDMSLIMSTPVWRQFVVLDEVKDLLGFKYSQTAYIRPEQIATALGIRQVIIARGRYNSAEDGQTDSFSNLWGKHCWAAYIPRQPKIKEICFGYTCRRSAALQVSKWRDEDIEGWWVKCKDEYDQYIMDETAVYMIKNAVA